MKLLNSQSLCSFIERGTVGAIGNFDGVHIGHQQLIFDLKLKAKKLNLPLVVVLFEPQPKEYFQRSQAPARLSTIREKLMILKQCEVDAVLCIRFTKKIAECSAREFVTEYLIKRLNTKYLLVGRDFKFGKNREGDLEQLIKLCEPECEVSVCPDLSYDGERVSSTKVRALLQHAQFKEASLLLGRTYSLYGRVIRGDGRGRQWGIPTANIGLRRAALPFSGVYIVEVEVQGTRRPGVANIGCRPTVDGLKNVLEVHLLDFNESIYGAFAEVFFLHKVRDEVKFDSVDALLNQIRKDIVEAYRYFDLRINVLE